MQTIQENLQFIKENLSIASIVISILALLATWGNFLNSKKAFLANNYPKLKAELFLMSRDHLPVYRIYNESDKIIANDIEIKINIIRCSEFKVFKGKWITYTSEKLARLKPLESFIPKDLSSDELIKWLKDRGHESNPVLSIKDQEILSKIVQSKSYKIRLDISFTSNIFGADKICKISKKYKLVSCSREEVVDIRDAFYWSLKVC